ncbi:hypothetical protein SRABI76_02730 [Microbacterium oxydans]|uniref:Fis family transcriptional regulator n=1 Tax=Microbacterium oxydans TaxID=82380 RepID=A0A0F0L6Q1_9MICO|nr:hypothetical protein [Microbacterium oxydans]KJL28369.1 hypothetical protein RS83_03440 [Microbacterium oxydans]CAH0230149.1 hypothetical protein SRABI76_02730 [Microbacterium oxydans]
MHWDRLFEDLEGQLAAEWESERAALSAESERLRISRLDLRSRLRLMSEVGASVAIELASGRRLPVTVRALGSDWIAVESAPGDDMLHGRSVRIVPLHAVRGIRTDHGTILASLENSTEPDTTLRERMTFGFVLRDLARRRVPVHLSLLIGDDVHGTIDRAGSDHLDLAVHDAGTARLAGAVQGFRIIPFSAVASVRTPGDHRP